MQVELVRDAGLDQIRPGLRADLEGVGMLEGVLQGGDHARAALEMAQRLGVKLAEEQTQQVLQLVGAGTADDARLSEVRRRMASGRGKYRGSPEIKDASLEELLEIAKGATSKCPKKTRLLVVLALTESVPECMVEELLSNFGSLEELLEADERTLAETLGVDDVPEWLAGRRGWLQSRREASREFRVEQQGRWLVANAAAELVRSAHVRVYEGTCWDENCPEKKWRCVIKEVLSGRAGEEAEKMQALASLKGCVQYYGHNNEAIVMELGCATLHDVLAAGERLSEERAKQWVVQLISAVEELHDDDQARRGGRVHRDLKPTNVALCCECEVTQLLCSAEWNAQYHQVCVKLIDLESVVTESEHQEERLWRRFTPAWAMPEVVTATEKVSFKMWKENDWHAVGKMLLAMLSSCRGESVLQKEVLATNNWVVEQMKGRSNDSVFVYLCLNMCKGLLRGHPQVSRLVGRLFDNLRPPSHELLRELKEKGLVLRRTMEVRVLPSDSELSEWGAAVEKMKGLVVELKKSKESIEAVAELGKVQVLLAVRQLTFSVVLQYRMLKVEHFGARGEQWQQSVGDGFVEVLVCKWDQESEHARMKGGDGGARRMVQEWQEPVDVKKIWEGEKKSLLEQPAPIRKDVKRVLIQGDAGAGKTTLLKHLTHEWACGRLWNDRFDVVVCVRLREVPEKMRTTLEDVLVWGWMGGQEERREEVKLFVKWCGCEENAKRVLWVLDGWDEVAVPQAGSALGRILRAEQREVQFLLAGRRADSARQFAQLDRHLALRGFSEVGIEQFIDTYFVGGDQDEASHMRETVKSSEWVHDACRLPLMLALTCVVAPTLDQALTRTKLYKMVLDKMLQRYLDRTGREDLRLYYLLEPLGRLAWESFLRRELVVTRDEIDQVAGASAAAVEKSGILRKEGLMIGRTSECFGWHHYTIQEYLAAWYACEHLPLYERAAKFGVIRADLGSLSDVFFSFVCGCEKDAECLKAWLPRNLLLPDGSFDRGPVFWISEGGKVVVDVLRGGHWSEEMLHDVRDRFWMLAVDVGSVVAAEFLEATSHENFAGLLSLRLGLSGLMVAAQRGRLAMVRKLLRDGAGVNTKGMIGLTPLFMASFFGHVDVVRLLLGAGARLDEVETNMSPLLAASMRGYTKVVRLLLDVHGVDVDSADDAGWTPLYAASECGSAEVVELLLRSGASVNAKNNANRSPLWIASSKGHVNVVQLLLGARGTNVDAEDAKGVTPLHIAADYGSAEVVKLLMGKGANVNAKDVGKHTPLLVASFKGHATVVQLLLGARGVITDVASVVGTTPLHAAVRCGWPKVVELLVEKGANVNAKDGQKKTPLLIACALGRAEVVQVLLGARGVNVECAGDQGVVPLHVAAHEGWGGVVELLVAKGAKVNAKDFKQRTPLLLASFRGHANVVQLLLGARGVLINAADGNGSTSLHVAAECGRSEVVGLLLSKGANVNARTCQKRTPLFVASMKGHADVVRLLLDVRGLLLDASNENEATSLHVASESGFAEVVELLVANRVDVNARDRWKRTPLLIASFEGHVKVVKLLLEACDIIVDAVDENGATPLHIAVHFNWGEVVELLVAKGANVNAKDVQQHTPLLVASFRGHANVVQLLLGARGVLINAADGNGSTSLHVAAECGRSEVVGLLLSKGANVNAVIRAKRVPLCMASANGHVEVVHLLLNAPGVIVDAVDEDGRTPLQFAAIFGHVNVVALLLENGANVNAVDQSGCTPLLNACCTGHLKVVQLLLETAGVAINASNEHGTTPLHAAAYDGRVDMVELLLGKGAHVWVEDSFEQTPLSVAKSKGHVKVVQVPLAAVECVGS
jgi:ankyrin repeat protein/serine/threonine protein kinase